MPGPPARRDATNLHRQDPAAPMEGTSLNVLPCIFILCTFSRNPCGQASFACSHELLAGSLSFFRPTLLRSC